MERKKTSRIWNYQNGIVLMMFFTFGIVFMERLSVVFLFPFINEDLHLTNTQMGLIASTLAISWALGGYIFSSVSDLIGSSKKVLVPAAFVFSFCTIVSGLARNFATLVFARALMGISEGPVLPIAQATIAKESTPNRRGLNAGIVQGSSQLIGATLTPLIVTALAVKFSWQVAFFVISVPGFIMALILWLFMRDHKPSEGTAKKKKISWEEYSKVFKERNIWLCVIISMFFMTWLFVYTTFAPTYLVEVGYTPSQMSVIMSGIGLGSFLWMILLPVISDKLGRKPTLIVCSFIAVFSPLILGYFHFSTTTMFFLMFLITTGTGIFPLFMAVIPGESLPIGVVATAIGLIQLVGEIIGGSIGPTFAGIMADSYGLTAPLWIAAVGALVCSIVGFGLKETAPNKVKKEKRAA